MARMEMVRYYFLFSEPFVDCRIGEAWIWEDQIESSEFKKGHDGWLFITYNGGKQAYVIHTTTHKKRKRIKNGGV